MRIRIQLRDEALPLGLWHPPNPPLLCLTWNTGMSILREPQSAHGLRTRRERPERRRGANAGVGLLVCWNVQRSKLRATQGSAMRRLSLQCEDIDRGHAWAMCNGACARHTRHGACAHHMHMRHMDMGHVHGMRHPAKSMRPTSVMHKRCAARCSGMANRCIPLYSHGGRHPHGDSLHVRATAGILHACLRRNAHPPPE